jgi:hypothetical protein
MEAVKWFGYVVAAITLLSVLTGVGLLIVAIVITGGAIFAAIALVGIVATSIKGHFDRT